MSIIIMDVHQSIGHCLIPLDPCIIVLCLRRNMNIEDILSMEELITQLAMTVSCGGNLLMNVGPTSQGTIPTIFQV